MSTRGDGSESNSDGRELGMAGNHDLTSPSDRINHPQHCPETTPTKRSLLRPWGGQLRVYSMKGRPYDFPSPSPPFLTTQTNVPPHFLNLCFDNPSFFSQMKPVSSLSLVSCTHSRSLRFSPSPHTETVNH